MSMQDCHRGQVTSGNKWETVAKLTAHPQSNFWITNHKSPTENSPANNSHSYTATASIQRIISLEPKSKFPLCVARSLESSKFRALSARIECGTFALLLSGAVSRCLLLLLLSCPLASFVAYNCLRFWLFSEWEFSQRPRQMGREKSDRWADGQMGNPGILEYLGAHYGTRTRTDTQNEQVNWPQSCQLIGGGS